jgi:hypothetical protein
VPGGNIVFRNGEGLFYRGTDCEPWHPVVDIPHIEQPVQRKIRFLGRIRRPQDLEHIKDIRAGDIFIYKDILYTVENVTFDVETMETRIHAVGVDEYGKEIGIVVCMDGRYLEYDSVAEKDIEERAVVPYFIDMENEEEELDPSPELDEFLNEFSIIGGTHEI